MSRLVLDENTIPVRGIYHNMTVPVWEDENIGGNNQMEKVCEILGLELNEPFRIQIEGDYPKDELCTITKQGLKCGEEFEPNYLRYLLTGMAKICKNTYRPLNGEKYFSIIDIKSKNIEIRNKTWNNTTLDYALFKAGNVFKSEQAARNQVGMLHLALKYYYEYEYIEEFNEKMYKKYNDKPKTD